MRLIPLSHTRLAWFVPAILLALVLVGCDGNGLADAGHGPDTTGPAAIAPLPDYPVMPLDEAHNALWQDSAQIFLSRPVSRLAIRQGDYTFHVPSDLNRPDILKNFGQADAVTGPNMVHVLYRDNLYRQPWMPAADGVVLLDAAALGKGTKGVAISRFEARQTIYILIGFEGNPAEVGAEAPFAPFYALRVLVDENPLRFIKQKGGAKPLKTEPNAPTRP